MVNKGAQAMTLIAVHELRERFPEVSVEVSEGSTSEVLELLEGGIVDVGVVRTPFKSEGLRCRFAAAEPLVAVMPTDLEVGLDLSCTLEDLAAVPLALVRRQVPAVSSAFAEKGLSPQVACVMDDVRTCVLWAREGMAVALAPRSLIRVTDTGDQFINRGDVRQRIHERFGAKAVEMEGGAVAQACYMHGVPCGVLRSISDGANGQSDMDYPTFTALAASHSQQVVERLLTAL